MELKRLFEIFFRRWPIIVTMFVATTALTFWWVQSKPDTYRASGTYVVRPRLDPTGQVDVGLIQALINGVEIPATYASIARSDVVRDRAKEELGPRARNAGLGVGAELVTGTNTVEISARGRVPEITRDFAIAVGTATSEYVDELRDTYRLELLDAPQLPTQPIDMKRNLTIAVGAMLGALLGFAFAAFLDTFGVAWRASRKRTADQQPESTRLFGHQVPKRNPAEAAPDLAHVLPLVDAAQPDEIQSDSTCDHEFQRALRHATQSGRPHSLGVMKIAYPAETNGNRTSEDGNNESHEPPRGDQERVDRLLRSWGQRSGGTFSYLENGMFAILLPDMSAAAASKLLADWAEMLSIFELNNDGAGLQVAIGVREYPRRGMWSPAPTTRTSAE